MSRSWTKITGLLIVGLGLALALGLWAGRDGGVAVAAPAIPEIFVPPSHVGASACPQCHAAQAAAWRSSHHAKAMQPATPATLLGRFDGGSITAQGITTTVFTRDGDAWARTQGPDGREAEFKVAFTFGIHPLQQYLVAFPGGRLQVLPVAWDSRSAAEGGQRWFSFAPDEPIRPDDPLHWTGRNQTWNFMCADCHSTGVAKGYDLTGDSYHTTVSDLSVACESCHGPGARHVAWARAGADPAADPARGLTIDLSARQGAWGGFDSRGIRAWSGATRSRSEQEVCATCHARRRALGPDPLPTGRLLDTHAPTLLDQGLYHADGQIRDEVFEYGSFLQSRMHRAGVTCSDCHEPHGLGLRAPGNALCTQCHQAERFDTSGHTHHPAGGEAAACVTCHMPTRTYMGVHARHDHSLRLPAPERSAALGSNDPCRTCHPDRTPQTLAATIRGWFGPPKRPADPAPAALNAAQHDATGAAPALLAAIASADSAPIARATALSLLARVPADAATTAALAKALKDPDPLVRLGALRGLAGAPPVLRLGAVGLLTDPTRAVRIETGRLLADIPAARLPQGAEPARRAALDAWVEAERAAADRPESHLNLGTLWADLGRADDAEAAYRTALRLDPRFVPALLDLADLRRATGREAEAEALLRQAVTIAPDDADARFALGLALVRGGRRAEAIPHLRLAATLRPTDAQYAYVAALALSGAGQTREATTILETAVSATPANRDLRLALIGLLRDGGNRAEAIRHATALVTAFPDDPDARALLSRLRLPADRP
jgi:predicted CXXCH cytochrome family protein